MKQNNINYLEFFKTVGKSKRLLRSGWIREKVVDPESVAEHSFRVGVLAMVLADKVDYPIDKTKLMRMALLHDLAEVITGDIVTERWDIVDVQKRVEKEKEERLGVEKIFNKIAEGKEYSEIFLEMIQRTTPEANLFWQLDKLEMALTALEYEEEQGKNLEEFFLSVALYYVKDEVIKDIFNTIIKSRRKEYQESLQKKLGAKI